MGYGQVDLIDAMEARLLAGRECPRCRGMRRRAVLLGCVKAGEKLTPRCLCRETAWVCAACAGISGTSVELPVRARQPADPWARLAADPEACADFGQLCRNAREELGMSCPEVGREAKAGSSDVVSSIEDGECARADRLRAVGELLGVRAEEALG
mgnify:CR=1 FL=1